MEAESSDCTAEQADVTDDVTADWADPEYVLQYKLSKKPDTVTLNLSWKGSAKVLTPSAGRMLLQWM